MFNFDINKFEAYLLGIASFPVFYYVLKNFGSTLWSDLGSLWAKLFTKTTTVVVAPVATTTPVTNGI